MIKLIFDTNIYDQLAKDAARIVAVADLVSSSSLQVIVTRTIAEELARSPFKGIPDFFPTHYIGNTVAVAGIMCAGDSLGGGDVYFEHIGTSKKKNDALIADAASWHADWLVSEDTRLRERLNQIGGRCTGLTYDEFAIKVDALRG